MKYTLLLSFASCFLLLGLVQADEDKEDHVINVTSDNYETILKQYPYVLIEFYAPWCGHCKALAPEYSEAAKQLHDEESPIKLAKVDATSEGSIAEGHNVRGYPTLKFYRKDEEPNFIDYNGGRKASEIVNWLKKKTGPPAKEVKSIEEAKNLVDENTVSVIAFFQNLDSEKAKIFLRVAGEVDEYMFIITSSNDLFSEYKAEDGTVFLLKKFDDKKVEFTDEFTEEKLKTFVKLESLPLIVEFNHDNAQKIFNGDIKNHLLLFLSQKAGHIEQYTKEFKKIAKEFRGKVLFVTINADEKDHERILEFFGIKEEDVPSMRIIKLEDEMSKFKPVNPELTTNNVQEFVSDFLEDKLSKHLLTETLPEDWNKNPVKVLVGTNFAEVAYDKEKKVLVEFYAPWCGHCNQLAPIYEQLGEKYKDNDKVIIAKMDATVNELHDVKVTSFPTIYLYKAETNEAVQYTGKRTLEGLSKFIDSDGAFGTESEKDEEEDEDDDVPRKDEL